MNIKISPSRLEGKLVVPPSKSISHRMLICQALADGNSEIRNLLQCIDTDATIGAMNALGAVILNDNQLCKVKGISMPTKNALINCHESGSTLRFLIPVAAALGANATFFGEGKLPERPITPYIEQLSAHGITFHTKTMPYKISGRLTSGVFKLSGDISSQFITGLLLALPLIEGDSEIILTSPLQSKPYVDITIDCMKKFGVECEENQNGYFVKGAQRYCSSNSVVEADMSQAAFFLAANCLGSKIQLTNLNENSVQGDREIINLTNNFHKSTDTINIDATDIPDLVPILTVMACFEKNVTIISGCERLRIKECDRLTAIATELNKLGGKIKIVRDSLKITPIESFCGGECNSWNDHRIAMCLAIAAVKATEPITISNAECVSKSYPQFFEDYKKLGGIANVV